MKNTIRINDAIGKKELLGLFKSGEHIILVSKEGIEIDVSNEEKIQFELMNNWSISTKKMLNKILAVKEFSEKRMVYNHYPLVMQLEHTSYCNAECIMCSHLYTGNNSAKHLSPEFLSRIEHLLPYLYTIVMHGNGEPFLNPYIDVLIKTYKKYDIQLACNTNLSILPVAVLENLDMFNSFHISCDSDNKDIYEYIRRGLSFEVFDKNIKLIMKRMPSSVSVRMDAVIMASNLGSLEGVVRYAYQNGIREVNLSRLGLNPVIACDAENPLNYPEELKRTLSDAIDVATKLGVRICYPKEFLSGEYLKTPQVSSYQKQDYVGIKKAAIARYEKFAQKSRYYGKYLTNDRATDVSIMGICNYIAYKTFIDLSGNVALCCMDSEHNIGNILTDDFTQIWNGKTIVKLREHFILNRLPEICLLCAFIQNDTLELV